LPSAQPGVWLGVAFLYLICINLRISFSSIPEMFWLVLVFGSVPLAVLPAIHAARRLSNPVRMGALRSEFGIGGPEADAGAVERAARRGFAAAHGGPFAAFALLVPIYVLILLASGEHAVASEERQGVILAFLLNGTGCVAAAVAVGAVSAGRRPGWAALRAVIFSLIFVGLRIALAFLVAIAVLNDGEGSGDKFDDLARLVYADLVLCCLLAVVLDAIALDRLRKRLLPLRLGKPPLPPGPIVRDARRIPLTPEELAGAGLDVSAWSLLRWRFWRDPLLRAERRHLWTRRRILILWLALPLVLAGLVVSGPLVSAAIFGLVSSSAGYGLLMMPWSTVVSGLAALPWACVPLIFMVAAVGGEKQSPVFESMLATPLTPLRLAAAKLLGKSWHLVMAVAVLWAIRPLLPFSFGGGLGWSDEPWNNGRLATLPFGMVNTAAYALMLGSVGMFFAARQRTLTGAVAGSLATALGLLLARSLLLGFVHTGAWRFYHGGDDEWLNQVAGVASGNLAMTILYLLVAGMFLAGAARHLALRRDA
jgi:hypothetical protein